MRALVSFAVFTFFAAHVHALSWNELKVGGEVELTTDLYANNRFSLGSLQCRIGNHVVWPKVKIGPSSKGPDEVSAQHFIVTWKSVDPFTYTVDMVSDQMPCGCVLQLMQTSSSEFKVLASPSSSVRPTPIATSCANTPSWVLGSEKSSRSLIESWGRNNRF